MADRIKAVKQQTVEAVAKSVNAWRRYHTTVFLTYLIVAVVVFIALAVLAKTIAHFTFDVTITRALQTYHPGWFDALMGALTWIGFTPQAGVITLIVLLFLYASGLKWETVVLLVSVLGSSALGLGIKFLVDRPRPSADLVNVINQLKDYFFPAGICVLYDLLWIFVVSSLHAAQTGVVAHGAAFSAHRHGGANRAVTHL